MTDGQQAGADARDGPDGPSRSRVVAVGCFTAVLGVVSGGMVAVLVSMFVGYVTRAEACPGIPTCNWYLYWAAGAIVGGITLPWLSVRSLRRLRRDGSR